MVARHLVLLPFVCYAILLDKASGHGAPSLGVRALLTQAASPASALFYETAVLEWTMHIGRLP